MNREMNHDHLPALKRYTSSHQYEAMQKIQDTKSMVKLLMDGAWSRTLGALLRSAWIAPHTYTDEEGVVREGWKVTDAGAHAMKLYEAKLAEEQQVKARQEDQQAQLYRDSVEWFRLMKICKAANDMTANYVRLADEYNNKTKIPILTLPAHMANAAVTKARQKVEQEPDISIDLVDEQFMAWRLDDE